MKYNIIMNMKRIRKFCLWIICLITVVIIIKVAIYFNDIAFVRDSVKNALNIDLPDFEIIQQHETGFGDLDYKYQIKFNEDITYLFDYLTKHEPSTYEVLKYRAFVSPNDTLWTQKFDYSRSDIDPENIEKWVKIMINSNSDTATVQIAY